MFKKAIILTFVILMLSGGLFLYLNNKDGKINLPTNNGQIISASLTPTPVNLVGDVTASGYTVNWVILRDSKKLKLYSNLEDELTSADTAEKYFCDSVTSGGFYSEDNKHLGLFIGEGGKITDYLESGLFNGILMVDPEGKFQITQGKSVPSQVRLALQSGPILIKNSVPVKLSLERDENARRIVAGITRKKELVLMIFYVKNQPLLGPTLEEMPMLLDEIQNTTNIKFSEALNLDGGSHSAFYSEEVRITEISNPGSYLCILS